MNAPLVQFDMSEFVPAIANKIKRIDTVVDSVAGTLINDANGDLMTATSKFRTPLDTAIHHLGTGNYALLCGDLRFLWLDKGTKRHDINAKTSMGMSFPWANSRKRGEHVAKTARSLKPGRGNGDTYRSGSSWTGGVMKVDHPGIKPRNWTGILLRKYRKEAVARMIRALRIV